MERDETVKTIALNIVSIGIGGAIGASLRFMINLSSFNSQFPFATLLENIIGSLLLGGITGYFVGMFKKKWLVNGLSTGFCGGLTTMSTFASDTIQLLLFNKVMAFLYIVSSLIGPLLAAFIGLYVTLNINKQKEVNEH